MTKEKNILFVHAGAELYGADKILLILVRGLVQRGWGVTVVVPWNGELRPPLEEVGASVVVMNHGVLRRKYFSPLGLVDRARRILRSGRSLAQIVREKRISVVHSNTSVVLAGAFTARLARIPHVWHIHEITTRPKFVWRTLSWLIPRGADRVVCVSQAVHKHLVAGNDANAKKGIVIHNGIEPIQSAEGDRERIRQELGLGDDIVLVGMVGRVNNWKGQMALADAAERLVAAQRDMHFLFVGGTFAGEEHLLEALRARISNGPLAGKATVFEYRKDVGALMSAFDIFVLPSTQPDPLPTVVLEAMSIGLPVVGFAHGGVCEMVADGENGVLVPPCDAIALAGAIEKLALDSERRAAYGRAGQQRFSHMFSVEAFLSKFEEMYANVLGC